MIEAVGLTKTYGKHRAINDVSFNVIAGEIVGFLGPNGAGKSTTMNILTGYISSTSGTAKIAGFDILEAPEKAKQHIGYLPETPPVYGDMKVDEYLNFVADLKKVKSSDKPKMIDDIKETVRISDMSKRLIKNLSKGYRQRVGLAQALMGYPDVLILDEPTVGLDPKQIVEVRDLIKHLGKKHTIILSSHILSEVSAVCDRVIIINKGEIVASDAPERLSANIGSGRTMAVRIKGEEDRIRAAFGDVQVIKSVKLLGSREPGTFELELAADSDIDIRESIFACAAKNNLPILMMKSLDLTLEEVFMQLTESETHGGGADDDGDN